MRRDFPPARFYVAGLRPTGLTRLAGPPKGGKSWMAYQIVIAVAGGYRCLGEQAPVLYLALEDTPRRLKSRAAHLLDRAGWAVPAGLTLTCESAVAGAAGSHRLEEWYAENPFDRISGTQGIGGAADSMLVLDRRGNATQMFAPGRDLGQVTFALDFGGALWSVTGSSEGVEPVAPAGRGPVREKRDMAEEWLAELLAAGPVPATEVEEQAGKAGFSWATIRRAKDELRIKPRRDGFGGPWVWELPVGVQVGGPEAHRRSPPQQPEHLGEVEAETGPKTPSFLKGAHVFGTGSAFGGGWAT